MVEEKGAAGIRGGDAPKSNKLTGGGGGGARASARSGGAGMDMAPGVLEREGALGGGSKGGSVPGSLMRVMFVPVRTNTGVPVFEGGLGGEGERMTGGALMDTGGARTGSEDSKSPKSSKESLVDEVWSWLGADPVTKSANRSVSAGGARPMPGGGGKAGMGGESSEGTSERKACWARVENEVWRR